VEDEAEVKVEAKAEAEAEGEVKLEGGAEAVKVSGGDDTEGPGLPPEDKEAGAPTEPAPGPGPATEPVPAPEPKPAPAIGQEGQPSGAVAQFITVDAIDTDTATRLAKAGYRDLDELREAVVDDLVLVPGINMTKAEAIVSGLRQASA
jgi:hypothetical protein